MTAPIRRALLSVSNKEGLLEFARALRQRGVAILSTGGTAALLREDGQLHGNVQVMAGAILQRQFDGAKRIGGMLCVAKAFEQTNFARLQLNHNTLGNRDFIVIEFQREVNRSVVHG